MITDASTQSYVNFWSQFRSLGQQNCHFYSPCRLSGNALGSTEPVSQVVHNAQDSLDFLIMLPLPV